MKDTSEKIPLLVAASSTSANSFYYSPEKSPGPEGKPEAYLLLTVAQPRNSLCARILRNIGTYCGVVVAVNLIVIILVAVIWITLQADVHDIGSNNWESPFKYKLLAGVPHNNESYNDDNINVFNPGPSRESKVIETPQGKIKGYVRKSRAGRTFLAFYKVPYAKPPINELRFRDPQPASRWQGIRDEAYLAPQCIKESSHSENTESTGEEDCLYANIYVPNEGRNATNYPTMVYIHGGGFSNGRGSRYGAEYFMDEDVVLITFQYRLGIFGFLSTGDREATGNMGLKDQVMMLKWVQQNIQSYGGDPNRVTVFGNSLGAFGVSYLMISPMAKGLFHRGISQSATALCETISTSLDTIPQATVDLAAQSFNCPRNPSSALLNCLREISASDLAVFHAAPETKYGLTVEKGFDFGDLSSVFMPDQPYNMLKDGRINNATHMIGVVSTEFIGGALGFLQNKALIETINSNFSFLTNNLFLKLSPEESQSFKTFYFGENSIGNHTERNLTNLLSDWIFVHCSKAAAELFAKKTDTFLYYLSKHPGLSYVDKKLVEFPFIDKEETCSHADEVQFLFPYPEVPEYPVSDEKYYPFSKFMVKLWAYFAATGNPVMRPDMATWVTVSENRTPWFELNDFVGLTNVLDERMKFWDQFTPQQLNYILDF